MAAKGNVIPTPFDWHGPAKLHAYLICDVFTSEPLQGNQLCVFLDGRALSAADMQRLAQELNFHETVFLLPPASGGDVSVRIFTPRAEMPFAGHPVLGTAVVVAMALAVDRVTLGTRMGLVPVRLTRDGAGISGWMRQPLPSWGPFGAEPELLGALGVKSSLLPVEAYCNGPTHVFVRLADQAAVEALRPDLAALADLGIAASCFAGRGHRYKTRMFFPSAGIPEDPATGSAAGPLAVHLARHGEISYGEQIEVHQGAEIGRPSVLYATAAGDRDRLESVEVGGRAVIVAEGRYRITAPGLS